MTEMLSFDGNKGVLEELAFLWQQRKYRSNTKLLTITAMLMTMKHPSKNDHQKAIQAAANAQASYHNPGDGPQMAKPWTDTLRKKVSGMDIDKNAANKRVKKDTNSWMMLWTQT